jgi:predicted RNase H-like nuclease
MWVAGADGCPKGWLAVFRSTTGEPPRAQLFETFAEIVATGPAVIAVDIPIGLPEISERGGRTADREARKLLGRERQSSVFAAPSRAALAATSFEEACRIELRHSRPPKKVSQQIFNIFKKIREVDGFAKRHPDTIFECHPEVSFCAMNNNMPMRLAKKLSRRRNPSGLNVSGLEERSALLAQNGYTEDFVTKRIGRADEHSRDDLIDACAAAWTAERIYRKDPDLVRIPKVPDYDNHPLHMAIWA